MSFGLYLGGILFLLTGLILGAAFLHVPAKWIIVGSFIVFGAGVLAAVAHTRSKDRSA